MSEKDGSTNRSKYFNLSDATRDVKDSLGAAETAGATAKLVGKGLFNVGLFALTELPEKLLVAVEKQKSKKV